jgi:hypothetical protein
VYQRGAIPGWTKPPKKIDQRLGGGEHHGKGRGKGVDDVEGRSQEATPITSFIFNAPVHSSVIGTHNPAELINNFDFSSIEERIEREGDAYTEEPRGSGCKVRHLLEEGETLDRGALPRFSAALHRHEWFTGSVMQALLRFAAQASG